VLNGIEKPEYIGLSEPTKIAILINNLTLSHSGELVCHQNSSRPASMWLKVIDPAKSLHVSTPQVKQQSNEANGTVSVRVGCQLINYEQCPNSFSGSGDMELLVLRTNHKNVVLSQWTISISNNANVTGYATLLNGIDSEASDMAFACQFILRKDDKHMMLTSETRPWKSEDLDLTQKEDRSGGNQQFMRIIIEVIIGTVIVVIVVVGVLYICYCRGKHSTNRCSEAPSSEETGDREEEPDAPLSDLRPSSTFDQSSREHISINNNTNNGESRHKRVLQRFWKKLTDNLDPKRVIDDLFQNKVIEYCDVEEIRTASRREGTFQLLDLMMRGPETAVKQFAQTLARTSPHKDLGKQILQALEN
jgi:hypothetical protein